jgi:hypothetical protein
MTDPGRAIRLGGAASPAGWGASEGAAAPAGLIGADASATDLDVMT